VNIVSKVRLQLRFHLLVGHHKHLPCWVLSPGQRIEASCKLVQLSWLYNPFPPTTRYLITSLAQINLHRFWPTCYLRTLEMPSTTWICHVCDVGSLRTYS
jgi:hypothetical protein